MECTGDSDSDSVHSTAENLCEIKSDRKCTDKAFFILLILSLVALISCLGYCINHGDLDRLINGYDDCGNICGKSNIQTKNLNFECYGKNMEEKKYLLYKFSNDYYFRNKYIIKECVSSCNVPQDENQLTNRCYNPQLQSYDDTLELFKIIQLHWPTIIFMLFFAIFFSFSIIIMFRFQTALTINIILFGFSILSTGVTIFLWQHLSKLNKSKDFSNYNKLLYLSIIASVVTCVLLLILFAVTKRLSLIIAIFKESAKAIADMPLLLLQPLVTCLTILFIIMCGLFTYIWLISCGHLKKLSTNDILQFDRKPGSLNYENSDFTVFVMYLNYFIIYWMINLVVACQHIIVAGSVAAWFFTRNKMLLESPITNSIYNLIRYHLGTACLGSLVITIFGIVKAVVRCLKTVSNNKDSILACILYCLLKYILDVLELFLKFFSINAYIQTAIHGYSFCKAGKTAFILLVKNIFDVIVINSIGDYVLNITKLFIAAITMLLCALLLWSEDNTKYMMSTIMITGCISFFIAHTFLTVYEMAIDTIFLCFCEDCEVNDGIAKPYFMSRHLMEIVAEGNNKKLNSSCDLHFSDTGSKRKLTQGF